MARRLESLPVSATSRDPGDEWLDGSPWELVRGDDFTSRSTILRASAQIQAKKRGGTVRTKRVETTDGREALVIQYRRAEVMRRSSPLPQMCRGP